ncbi:TolC family outer membrane protein [Phenylobacterium sp. J367]|uniref:TolC family outer membrane protein n=1 Tax=Phenylobacterium sp. J367 TaxID=2898435 RepID=UPI0021518863|nr:TolC family outer membrane protein [Phenylobacterium sp. J367]MCR5879964.1 TolC family outer membrane protein [Phenylobacterium sp. J367]
MSKSLRGRLMAAIFSVGAAGAVAAPVAAETLADAIAAAYESNPTLQAQRASQRALDESYVQARTGWRPTLNVSGQAAWSDVRTPREALTSPLQRTIVDGNSGSTTITFSQPIWTGGRVAAAVSAANADVLAGRENLRRIEAQVLGQVITAYADVRRDQEAVLIRQENVSVLQRQLDESNARFEVGEITRTDVAQSQARLAAAQSLLESTQAQLGNSRSNYATVVGRNPGTLEPEPSLAFLLPPTVDEAFQVAEQYSPLLRGQQYAEAASRARLAGAHAERLPNVAVSSTTRFGPAPLDPFERGLYPRETVTAIGVTVPLFSGGLVSSRIRAASERNNADRINVETQRRTVLQQVTQAWNQLIASRANIASTAEQVRAAQIAAEGTRQEQQVGLRTTIDVLNAEQELRAGQLAQVTARRDEYVAAASVISAMGRLEGRNLVPTVPQYDASRNFRKLRITWGWVPWEEPIAIIDRTVALPPTPHPAEKAVEAPIGPGLQPPPVAQPAPGVATQP